MENQEQPEQKPKKSPILKILFALLILVIIILIVIGVKGEYFKGMMLNFSTPIIDNTDLQLPTDESEDTSSLFLHDKAGSDAPTDTIELDTYRPIITIVDTVDGTPDGEKVTGTFERPPTTLEKFIAFRVEGDNQTGTEGNRKFRLESVEFEFEGCIMETPTGTLKAPPDVKITRTTIDGEIEETSRTISQLNDNWGTVFLAPCADQPLFDSDTTTVFTVATNLAYNCYYNKATITTNIKNVIYSDEAGNRYEMGPGNVIKEAEATKTFMFNIYDYI